ncbi:MAG: GNAT family N-acetyltransferase [Acidimicrobiia bacterium]|nr:GNAT family N-acetyltransferase [Acidimicrobiia bacterium]
MGQIELAPIRPDQDGELFDLFARIVAAGEGFPHAPPLTRAQFDDTWVRPVTTVIAANVDGDLAGAYYLKPNSPGRAAHIANAGYVVSSAHRGTGVGRALVEDSITRAPTLGFDAIQFNLVFASNPARALYEALGWREIGRVPDAVSGEEAVIYWRAV